MRGAALPAALLCLSFGLMLAFAPRRVAPPALSLLGLSAAGASLIALSGQWLEAAFLGCWASVIALALVIHLPRGIPAWLALIFAVGAGLCAGILLALEGQPADLLLALPCALAAVPARWALSRGWGIAPKVIGSWLIAVALLAALLPTIPTPGYVPDHKQ